jgi:hypothetical protein
MEREMKERPMLFSRPMVRALLEGVKTQTRRPVKGVALEWLAPDMFNPEYVAGEFAPYGKPGDRLWVRESFWCCDLPGYEDTPCVVYDDEWTGKEYLPAEARPWGRKFGRIPAIHMPRESSRILLEVVAVRIERLNDCSEADAKAEGVMQLDADEFERPMESAKDGWKLCPKCNGTGLHNGLGPSGGVIFDIDCRECDTHLKLYRHLWESINGPDSWAVNPWVWVIDFKLVTP